MESFFTVAITSASPGSRVARMVVDGAQAVTCTRCLRHPNSKGTVFVHENFLLELPHGIASALAEDVNAELRRRRTRSGVVSPAHLHHALTVIIRQHDQKIQSINGGQAGLRATGEYVLQPHVLREAALKSLEHSLARDVVVDDLQADVTLRGVAEADGGAGESVAMRMQLQRVASWIDDTPDAVELSQSESQRGNRSLRMGSADMRWQPIVQDGMKHSSTGTNPLSGSMLGLDVMSGLVLEESFAAGVRRETVRSSVRLRNSLDFCIEVGMLELMMCTRCHSKPDSLTRPSTLVLVTIRLQNCADIAGCSEGGTGIAGADAAGWAPILWGSLAGWFVVWCRTAAGAVHGRLRHSTRYSGSFRCTGGHAR